MRASVYRASRGRVPYYLTAFAAISGMAWYFFLFVPAKLDYFLGVRLRVLAVAGNQLRSKAVNLESALAYAAGCGIEARDIPTYLRLLVPDLELDGAARTSLPGLRVSALTDPCRCGAAQPAASPSRSAPAVQRVALRGCGDAARISGTIAWPDLVAEAATISRSDLDDLVLALPGGEVVWQREETTPRVGNLAQVLYTDVPDRGWFGVSWNVPDELPTAQTKPLPTAVATKRVSLGGKDVLLLVQPVTLHAESFGPRPESATLMAQPAPVGAADQGTRTLFLAAVVSRAALLRQAMDIPLAWVMLVALPLVLLLLALPFVKLATLTGRERFAFVDTLGLIAATVVLASIAAVLPLVDSPVEPGLDRSLRQFAWSIERALVGDLKAALAFARHVADHQPDIERALAPCTLPLGTPPPPPTASAAKGRGATPRTPTGDRRCDLWAALPRSVSSVRDIASDMDLDVVIWLDSEGMQVRKWTTKAQLTQAISHKRLAHFRRLAGRRLWTLAGAPGFPPFIVEPLRAPTTSELGVVIASPLPPQHVQADARYMAMNVRLPSVQDVVVPPDYGFAVVGAGGEVLFHSDENRSGHENFFEEVGNAAAARRRAESGHTVNWSDDYHGKPHRLQIQTIEQIEGASWQVVTYKDLSAAHDQAAIQQSAAFRLILINVLLLCTLAAVTFGHARVKRRDSGNLLNVSAVARPRILWALPVLVVLGVILISLTHVPASRQVLDGFYLVFVVLPFVAIAVSVKARERGVLPAQAPNGWHRVARRGELALLVLLVAAIPAAGFARIADRLASIDEASTWLEAMQRRISERHARVVARVNAPAYGDLDSTRARLMQAGFARPWSSRPIAYLDFLGRVVHTRDGVSLVHEGTYPPQSFGSDSAQEPTTGQRVLRFLLRWNPLPSDDDAPGHPAVVALASGLRLDPAVRGFPALQVQEPLHAQPHAFAGVTPFSWPTGKLLLGLGLLGAAIAAAYWARRKLTMFPPVIVPTLEQVVANVPTGASAGVLLIGAPRTRKDKAVTQFIGRADGDASVRIRLLNQNVTPAFVEHAARDLRDSVTSAAGPSAGTVARAPCRLWIHVSNLETHLVDADSRQRALSLLERLFDERLPVQSRIMIVTSAVDPIAHFDEIFEEERRGIYESALPEVALSRVSLLLTLFRRCYVPICDIDATPDAWWDYRDHAWREVLAWETRLLPLRALREELLHAWRTRDSVSLNELHSAILIRAHAYYQLLWTSCTRHEKLVLVQLAQEGFVPTHSADVVAALMAKGLIMGRPGPQVFNYSFRSFLRRIERSAVLRSWEEQHGQGLWVVAGRLVAGSVIAGGIFFLLTQGYSLEAFVPVVSGTGVFGVPIVRNLLARFSGGAGGVGASPA